MDEQALQQVQQILGHIFADPGLIAQAFTHSSSVDHRLHSNERLEFLGDSILAAVICQDLFDRYPTYLEGELTKMKSSLVSRGTCARLARRLDLLRFLDVGKGMTTSHALPSSLAAGLLEALVAVLYIDGGLDAARNFILKNFEPLIEKLDGEKAHGNYKSLLQQHAQEQFGCAPQYVLLDEKGPDHNKCFESEVVIAERHFPSAWGPNKKEAEQKAAFNALTELGILPKPTAKKEG